MPRSARFIAPGVAHHITQRGVDRKLVFRTRLDRLVYLGLLRGQARLAELPIWAYCLMGNHIHLIAVPADAAQLAEVMQRVHGRYAQYFNARRGRCGHLWQNRFSSCALGPAHLWTALRYVELNPVRAAMVQKAEDYEWSSARAHLAGQDPRRLLDMDFWRREGGVSNWLQLLNQLEQTVCRRGGHTRHNWNAPRHWRIWDSSSGCTGFSANSGNQPPRARRLEPPTGTNA